MIARRRATANDRDALVTLDEIIFGSDRWSAASWSDELADSDHRVILVAEDAATGLAGYAVLLIALEDAELLRIGVQPGRRRAGLGSRLMADVLAAAHERHCTRVLLEVAATNDAALAFYDHHGFVLLSRRPRYYSDGADAVVMAHRLGEDGDR